MTGKRPIPEAAPSAAGALSHQPTATAPAATHQHSPRASPRPVKAAAAGSSMSVAHSSVLWVCDVVLLSTRSRGDRQREQ